MAPSTGTVLVRALAIAYLFFRFLCNFTCNVSEAFMLSKRVLFCSSLSKVCSCISEPLMLAMRVLFFSCLRNVSFIDSKTLLHFTGLLAVMRASIFKVGHDHTHKPISSCVSLVHTCTSVHVPHYLQQVAKGFKIKRISLSLLRTLYLTTQKYSLLATCNHTCPAQACPYTTTYYYYYYQF